MPGWAIRAIVVGVTIDLLALLAAVAALALQLVPPSASLSVVRLANSDRFWMMGPPIALAVIATLAVLVRPVSLRRVARDADAILGLQERVSTALEIEERAGDEAGTTETAKVLSRRQRSDAVAVLRRHDAAEVFPIRLVHREVLAVSAACILLFGLVLVPELAGRGDRQLAELVARAEAERLALLADEISSNSLLTPEDREALAQALGDAAQGLETSTLSEEALSSLGQSEQALAQQSSTSGADSELALARTADALDQAAPSRGVAAALDRGAYAEAGQELARLGEEAAGLSATERQAVANALDRAARNTSRLDPALSEKLAAAAKSLGPEGGSSPESAFSEAGEEVRRAGADAAKQQALDRAIAALQGAKLAVTQAQSGRAMASAEAGLPDSSALGDFAGAGEGGYDSSESAGVDGSPGAGQGSGLDGQSGLGAAGGVGAGQGSLERRGESAPGDFRSRQVRVPTDDFGDPSISSGQSADEGPIGEATVDYRQVLAEYRDRATESMAQRYIPPSLKDLVAAYFTSLDSSSSAAGGSAR